MVTLITLVAAQRGHGEDGLLGRRCRPIPEQFPPRSGRGPRRLRAGIRPARGTDCCHVCERRGRNRAGIERGFGPHRVPEKFRVLAVKVRGSACLCAGNECPTAELHSRRMLAHPGWPRARPPRRPLRGTSCPDPRARAPFGPTPLYRKAPLFPSPASGLLASYTLSGPRRSQRGALSLPGPRFWAGLHVFSTPQKDCPRRAPGTRRGANAESGGAEWGPAALNIEQTTCRREGDPPLGRKQAPEGEGCLATGRRLGNRAEIRGTVGATVTDAGRMSDRDGPNPGTSRRRRARSNRRPVKDARTASEGDQGVGEGRGGPRRLP